MVKKLPDGRYETTLTVEAHKLYADGKGRGDRSGRWRRRRSSACSPRCRPRRLLAKKDVLLLQRLPLKTGTQTIRLVTAKKPAFAGADPYNVRIDRNSDDNVIATTE